MGIAIAVVMLVSIFHLFESSSMMSKNDLTAKRFFERILFFLKVGHLGFPSCIAD